ncbi:MAG: PKD domain-containing protein [Flavobacteriales bacterium]
MRIPKTMHDMNYLHSYRWARLKPRPMLLAMVLAGIAHHARPQVVVDHFNRPDDAVVGNGWTETESAAPSSTAIAANGLMMYAGVSGIDFIAKPTPGAYDPILSANGCLLTWQFNMRMTRLNPTGFNPGSYGSAVVLAGSHADLREGTGYAVVLGSVSGTIDPLRLVRYNGGLDANANLTDIAAHGDFGNEYLSVTVTYQSMTGAWNMYLATSTSSFPAMPEAVSPVASGNDGTYAGIALPYLGCYYNHGAVVSERVRFDNVRVPQDCSTRFDFVSSSITVNETAGTVAIPVQVTNPSPFVDSWVDVQLIAGDASRVDGFATGTIHFQGPNAATVELDLAVISDGSCTGDAPIQLQLANPVGGQGTPEIGAQSVLTLTIADDNRSYATLLAESFETDGAGSRYALNTPHAAPATDAYFMRGTSAELVALGGLAATSIDGARMIAVENLTAFAPDAEAILTFNPIDIKGVSGISISLLAGARNATVYDRLAAQRDYLIVQVRVDGGAWATVGAFRAQGTGSSVDKRLRLDTDLDGEGDGAILTAALQSFQFPVAMIGEQLEARVRARSTSGNEEVFYDNIVVQGTRCRVTHYSQASGNTSDAIWSNQRNGAGEGAQWNDHTASYVIQAGHTVVADDAELLIRNLTIEAGGSFDLGTAALEVRGDRMHASGPFSGTNGELRIRAEELILVDGPATCSLGNVNVAAGERTDMEGHWDIHGTLQLESGDFNALAGHVTLRSTVERTGRLGPVPADVDYRGEMKVERYIPGGNTNWRLLGSPVADNTVLRWQDDFITAGYPGSHFPNFTANGDLWPSIRYYIEEVNGPDQNDGLVGVTSSNMPLEMGRGYAAWSGSTLTTTTPFVLDVRGEPYIANEPIVLPLTWTDHDLGSDGWNLVSNPLPSPIDFTLLQRGDDVVNMYWIFNPATGTMASWSTEGGTNGANGIIQSSQGFWVRTKGPDLTLSVTESAKVDENSGGVFGGTKSQRQPSYVRLRIHSGINNFSDETMVFFHVGSPAFESNDVPKLIFSHPQAPQLASMSETGQWIAMNAYGAYTNDIVIPLVVDVAVTGTYTLTAAELVNLGLSCMRIEDLETGTLTPLTEGGSYTFTMAADANPFTIRFRLHGSAPMPLITEGPRCDGFVDGSAGVTLSDNATVTWSHAAGGVIAQQAGSASDVLVVDGLTAGDYTLSVVAAGGCAPMSTTFTLTAPAVLTAEAIITQETCNGNSDGLIEITPTGGTEPYAFVWNNGAEVATLQAGQGEYTAQVIDANGCTITTGPHAISVANEAVAVANGPLVPVQVTVPTAFSSLGSEGDTYHWDFGDGSTSDAPDCEHSYELPGTYQVVLTVEHQGCTATDQIEVVVETTTGLRDARDNGLTAWFAHDHIVIDYDRESATPVRIEVLNTAGQLHATHRATGVRGRILIPAADLAAGAWVMRITDDKGARALPFVVAQ